MILAQQQICRAAFWERLDGWEVVLTVLIVVTGWAVVHVARMYYMVKATEARHN